MEMPKNRFFYDLGWPWTSDKAMVSCRVCGMAMFIPIDLEGFYIPVHKHCVEFKEEKNEKKETTKTD